MSTTTKSSVKSFTASSKGTFKSKYNAKRHFQICVKGNCKYGTLCKRKCKTHRKIFSHLNHSHEGSVRKWSHSNDSNNVYDMDPEERLNYKLVNAVLICILLNILPNKRNHSFIFRIIEQVRENSSSDTEFKRNVFSLFSTQYGVIKKLQNDYKTLISEKTNSVKNSLVGGDEVDSLRLYRGFRHSYMDYLEYFNRTVNKGDIHTTGLFFSTTISENTAYNFVNRDTPVMWEIIVPKDKLEMLPYLIFHNSGKVMDISKEYEEYEVLLPVGTLLKFDGRKQVTHKSYRMPQIDGPLKKVDIVNQVTLYTFVFEGFDFSYFDRIYTQVNFNLFSTALAESHPFVLERSLGRRLQSRQKRQSRRKRQSQGKRQPQGKRQSRRKRQSQGKRQL